MMIYVLIFLGGSLLYSQCDEYNNEFQCGANDSCQWVEDIQFGNCSSLAWQVCESYPGCYVDSNPGWYDNSGPYCTGGTYQIDNSYCEEILMPECSEMEQEECETDGNCDWTEDIDYGSCSSLYGDECNTTDGCDWEYGCIQWGSWYTWICYTYGYECNGGNYQIDNSYCEESTDDQSTDCADLNENYCNHPLYGYGCEWVNGECQEIHEDEFECSDLDEIDCDNDANCDWIGGSVDCQIINSELSCNSSNCEWIEDIEYGNCSNYNNGSTCDANDNCYWDLCYGGSYGSWSHCCIGGTYQIDNSYCDGEAGYCEETLYESGDLNQDSLINIQDIIIVISLVLNGEFDLSADINFDNTVNVLDVIQLVNVILNN